LEYLKGEMVRENDLSFVAHSTGKAFIVVDFGMEFLAKKWIGDRCTVVNMLRFA
jgi:hypothetical protein